MKNLKRYGEWALITGASAGIGKAFAEAIASHGVNCVLTARRQERLEELAGELEDKHGVTCRCIKEDLTDAEAAYRLAEAVADLEVGLLVNNAGFGYAWRFESSDPKRIADMVNLNCLTPALLTRLLVPKMLERGRGAVVMVGSVLGAIPSPYESVYGATKAFDIALAEGLFGEYEKSGIDVIALCPSTTRTEFFVVDGMSEARANKILAGADRPEDIARLGLEYLGRKPRVGPWAFVGPVLLARILPRKWTIRIVRRFLKPYLQKDAG
ncbi:MAG: SDR family oxidoreductase [Candidatus Hydrogenedentota bacterium]